MLVLINLVAVISSIMMPLLLKMPTSGLDPSWAIAVNEAVARGLSFGDDIIFTYGPYAAINTRYYHPATDAISLIGGVFLALGFAVVFVRLLNGCSLWVHTVFWFALACVMYSWDAFVTIFPTAQAVLFTFSAKKRGNGSEYRTTDLLILAIGFACVGLLPLIKGSYLIPSLVCFVTCVSLATLKRDWTLVAIVVVSTSVSAVAFWIGADQNPVDLVLYGLHVMELSLAYTEAMALDVSVFEIFAYLVFCIAIGIWLVVSVSYRSMLFYVVFANLMVYLFISFKGAFVRGHELQGSTGLLLASLILLALTRGVPVIRLRFGLLIVMMASWAIIDMHHFDTSSKSVYDSLVGGYKRLWYGLNSRLSGGSTLQASYQQSLGRIRKEGPFKETQGDVDIYPFEQAILVAWEQDWNPRPVFQSYSVFTDRLAYLNRDHLASDQGARNIAFKVKTIDRRFPSLDDGATWPVLLHQYKSTGVEAGYLYLSRKEEMGWAPLRDHSSEMIRFDERVELSGHNEPLFIQMRFQPTLLGRFASFLLKPNQIWIDLELADHSRRTFRLISTMTKADFLFSPVVESAEEFERLLDDGVTNLERKKIVSFTIREKSIYFDCWQDTVEVTYRVLPKD